MSQFQNYVDNMILFLALVNVQLLKYVVIRVTNVVCCFYALFYEEKAVWNSFRSDQ